MARAADLPSDWALDLQFAMEPLADEVRTPGERGVEIAQRRSTEAQGIRCLAVRVSYPMAPLTSEQGRLYAQTIETLLQSRPGRIRAEDRFQLGAYLGHRLLIDQPRERTTREVRLVLVGATLYVLSAEWPGAGEGPAVARAFLDQAAVRPDFADPRATEARERWREVGFGHFRLRYDATRWYRDPTDAEPNVFNFLRPDGQAEAEFIAEREPSESPSMEAAVLATARENAESVTVRRRGRKYRGATSVEELRFAARTEGILYENHGYFYTGREGAVQLRAWAKAEAFAEMEGDIAELLDGLTIERAVAMAGGR